MPISLLVLLGHRDRRAIPELLGHRDRRALPELPDLRDPPARMVRIPLLRTVTPISIQPLVKMP